MVPLLGAIAGCHCSVRWLGGRATTNFWGGRGGIAGCYGCGRDNQLWRSGRGAIAGCHCSLLWLGRVDVAGCHCSVLWLGGRVTTNFGGVDVVPLITQKWFLLSGVYDGIFFVTNDDIMFHILLYMYIL